MDATDVFVIGGGPAGLATAIAARKQGFEVTVADGAHPPIDKACGEGLMPDGIAALEALGIRLGAQESHPLRGIRFQSSNLTVDAPFPTGASGVGMRRTVLHAMMVDHATALGINLLWKTVVTGISAESVHLGNARVRARWIVGADGAGSRVRRWAGLDVPRKCSSRFAFRRHYRVAPWSDRVEVHWDKHCQVYVTPVSAERVGLALLSRDPKLRLETALQRFPQLRARLAGADEISEERGASTSNGGLPRVYRDNVVLVGDASGTVDAISGEGLALSFRHAAELADCLAHGGDLASYQRKHRRMAFRPRTMARLLLALDGRPTLQRKVLQVFRSRPEIFHRLLALHMGAGSPLHLAVDGLTLGWGLLTV